MCILIINFLKKKKLMAICYKNNGVITLFHMSYHMNN